MLIRSLGASLTTPPTGRVRPPVAGVVSYAGRTRTSATHRCRGAADRAADHDDMAASSVLPHLGALLAGWLAWTAVEWAMHRWSMHSRRGRSRIALDHRDHHDRLLPVPLPSPGDWLAATIPAVAIGWWSSPAAGAGFLAGFALYALEHRAVHTRPARTRYGRWARRHHLHHHLVEPATNFGLTIPLWDIVFGTFARPGTIAVPGNLAVPWLIDERGRLRPAHAGDYRLVPVAAGEDDGDEQC